jgi:hypothetical protein
MVNEPSTSGGQEFALFWIGWKREAADSGITGGYLTHTHARRNRRLNPFGGPMVALTVALAGRRSEVRKKKQVHLKPPDLTARTSVRTNVSHPTLPGLVERVSHVLDRVDVLLREKKFGNEPIAARRRSDAARKFLHAWETHESVLEGAMDFERVRAPGIPGSPPIQVLLEASEVLRVAEGVLYPHHFRIIQHVVCGNCGVA